MTSGKQVRAQFVGGIGIDSPQPPNLTDVHIYVGSKDFYRAGNVSGGKPILPGQLVEEAMAMNGESRWPISLGECQYGQGINDPLGCWVYATFTVVENGFHLE
jgi:hypothetical protein